MSNGPNNYIELRQQRDFSAVISTGFQFIRQNWKTLYRPLVFICLPVYLVASVLIGSVAQRLVRRICPDCREPVEPTAAQRDQLALHGLEADRFYVGKGCESCLGGGYRGRIALYEILRVTAGIRDLIEGESMSSEIWRQARQEGMQTLLDSGLEKAVAGLIPFAEVARVCSLEVR